MATDISGPGGSFSSPTGFTAHISGWAATLNVTTVETTGFAEVGNRTYDATAIVMTGSADGTGQTVNTIIAATGVTATPVMSVYKGSFTLTAGSGDLWTFTGVMSNISVNRRHDGKLDVAFSFLSSGTITQTWG